MHYRNRPKAVVTAYFPPTPHQPSGRVEVECPHCTQLDRYRRPTEIPGRHLHGVGAAGSRPDLGDRVAHCGRGWPQGLGYEITDPNRLVPQRLEIEAASA